MMRNQYPGTCYRCGNRVEAGEGHFEKTPFSRGWRVQHATCAIEHRGTDLGKEGESEKLAEWNLRRLKQRALGTGKSASRARARLRQMGLLEPSA